MQIFASLRIEKHNNSYLCIAYEKHSLLLYSI